MEDLVVSSGPDIPEESVEVVQVFDQVDNQQEIVGDVRIVE